MNAFQRWFNRKFPRETNNNPNAGLPGAMGIHFDALTLDICAPSHDRGDGAIQSGDTELTYPENDARFDRCIKIAETEDGLFLNNADKRRSMIYDALSKPAIRFYRRVFRGDY